MNDKLYTPSHDDVLQLLGGLSEREDPQDFYAAKVYVLTNLVNSFLESQKQADKFKALAKQATINQMEVSQTVGKIMGTLAKEIKDNFGKAMFVCACCYKLGFIPAEDLESGKDICPQGWRGNICPSCISQQTVQL